MEQGATHIEHVKMSIYRGLSQDDALFLGVHHNQIHEISRPMTFIEKVSLLRKLGAANKKSKKEQEEFLQRLKAIFDYETTTKVRHNMKNHLRLAKVESEVWVLVVKVTQAWNRNIIPCRPQKKTIDQTFFVRLLREDLERQVDLLSTLMESGYREYLKKLNGKTHDVLEGACTQVVESNENIEAENENELMEENSILKDRIRQLEEENEALKNRVQEMDDEVKKLTNKQTVNGRKRKADAEKQMLFEVGGKVDALWRDKNPQATGWYEAVVKEVKENDYVVEFTDTVGQLFNVQSKHVRRTGS